MKVLITSILVLCIPIILVYDNSEIVYRKQIENPKPDFTSTKEKAFEAYTYCSTKKFNQDFCFLIDMQLHSGVNRFFVWDFKKDTIVYSCLVSHGCGNASWSSDQTKEEPVFSNIEGSHCSSLGKYKVAERAYSDWGVNIKYQLDGLETTNNNARSRSIVFHSWNAIPDFETYPVGTAEGWGCPALSNQSFLHIDSMLLETKKPVLMWIYL